MIDYHNQLVSALDTILPTWYEMALTSDTNTPCISYMELDNSIETAANKLEYCRISYQIKVWGNDLEELNKYACAIDKLLRPMGWKRTNCGELYDNQSAMIQKILTYEALYIEQY
jgi:hypothetical protein